MKGCGIGVFISNQYRKRGSSIIVLFIVLHNNHNKHTHTSVELICLSLHAIVTLLPGNELELALIIVS